MSVFSKFKSLFKSKNNVASKIKDTNEKKQFVVQEKFDAGLKKSSSILSQQVESIVKKHKRVDDDLIEAIEEMLITFDVGSSSTKKILDSIVDEIKLQNIVDTELVKEIIIDKLFVYYIQDTNVNTSLNVKKNQMNVILVCGVNGVGKTTSIAKLGNMYKQLGYSVCFVAGDTFRAGAIEQLKQ
jgi:fused signal recognition particle receptor